MHAYLLLITVALSTQLTDATEDRYPAQDTAPPADTWQPPPETTPPDARAPATTSADQPPATDPPAELAADQPPPITDESATEADAPPAKPSDLLQTLRKPVSQSFAGAPLALSEALVGATSRDQQTRRIELYWELSIAIAQYYTAERALTELQALRQGVGQPSASWDRWQAELQSRAQLAHQRAKSLQLRLASELGRDPSAELPVPSDAPHCGKYGTRYEPIFADRPSPEARKLHELLPLQYQALRDQAQHVAQAYQMLDVASRGRDPQSNGEELLQPYAQIANRRPHFLRLLRDYNHSIARYTRLALPGPVEPGRLVATLIQVPPTAQGTWQRGGVQRTSAEEPVDQQQQNPDEDPASDRPTQ